MATCQACGQEIPAVPAPKVEYPKWVDHPGGGKSLVADKEAHAALTGAGSKPSVVGPVKAEATHHEHHDAPVKAKAHKEDKDED
jgi:hypothetical protein